MPRTVPDMVLNLLQQGWASQDRQSQALMQKILTQMGVNQSERESVRADQLSRDLEGVKQLDKAELDAAKMDLLSGKKTLQQIATENAERIQEKMDMQRAREEASRVAADTPSGEERFMVSLTDRPDAKINAVADALEAAGVKFERSEDIAELVKNIENAAGGYALDKYGQGDVSGFIDEVAKKFGTSGTVEGDIDEWAMTHLPDQEERSRMQAIDSAINIPQIGELAALREQLPELQEVLNSEDYTRYQRLLEARKKAEKLRAQSVYSRGPDLTDVKLSLDFFQDRVNTRYKELREAEKKKKQIMDNIASAQDDNFMKVYKSADQITDEMLKVFRSKREFLDVEGMVKDAKAALDKALTAQENFAESERRLPIGRSKRQQSE